MPPRYGCSRLACAGSTRHDGRRSWPKGTGARRSGRSAARWPPAEDLEFAQAQARRISPARVPRASRHTLGAEVAKLAGHDRSCRPRTHSLQVSEREPQRLLLFSVRERERRLVRTAELCPQLRGTLPVARDLEHIGLGNAGRNLFPNPGTPTPEGKLTAQPGVAAPQRQLEGGIGCRLDRCGPSSSQAVSAHAAATGPILGSSPVGSASARASSSNDNASRSPRRARRRPTTMSPTIVGIVDARRARNTCSADSAASAHRPWSS